MNETIKWRRMSRWTMLAGFIFVAAGTIIWICASSEITSVERNRRQHVSTRYSGRAPDQNYELRKEPSRIYTTFAKQIICIGTAMIGLACLLIVVPRQLAQTKNKQTNSKQIDK